MEPPLGESRRDRRIFARESTADAADDGLCRRREDARENQPLTSRAALRYTLAAHDDHDSRGGEQMTAQTASGTTASFLVRVLS
jgi:hypothetical protein